MKNIARNTLGYTGVVTLSQYIGSKKVKIAQKHNRGGNPLFEFIANCLVGNWSIVEATRPAKIMLLSENQDSYTAKSSAIKLLTPAEKISNTVVKYSFMIQKDDIESLDFSNLSIGLYSNAESDIENFMAICKLDITKTQLTNAALLVDWELTFSNMSNAD